MNFISELERVFHENASAELAAPMEAYMKNNFPFLGIKTTPRRTLFKEIWNLHKEEIKQNTRAIALELYNKKEREFHYCAIEILMKELKKKNQKEDSKLIEKLIVTHSWWDSVDTIAKYLLGNYLAQFPNEIHNVINRFSNSDNIWLNRSSILFQLDYKTKTDSELLFSLCEKHKDSKEFFIQKAIGWALRDYSRFNPKGVTDFVTTTDLKPLSKREALRNL
ncbi:DNA alkylation repair protein [Flavobacterium sp. SM15]|uniref:DNA alkylation repair protein n=1 Tax=Flavobacterium sp. SM15 TaxID=2908005 RepID=UPI001EDC626A|nr:DNA alkylation repair protein [Flavobacterium sp. SM15]MCG2612318.1 DNA alkylation repair protein [Flavobacterium sp. SM15]